MYYLLCLLSLSLVLGYPQYYETKNFKVGIEYDHSLPMSGGSDRFRHRNNYDPFFVTVTAAAKKGFVISYLEVTATVDMYGEINFNMIRGQTGARNMVFQLVSNHTDFLSYSYLAYGIREEDYKKVSNIITLPVTNGSRLLRTDFTLTIFIMITMWYIFEYI